MKILAASDIHGDLDSVKHLVKKAKKERVDTIVLCWDLTFFDLQIDGLIKPFKDAGLKVILIPGNHESVATTDFLARFYGEGVYNLHGYYIKFGNIGFFGCAATSFGSSFDTDRNVKKMLKKAHNGISDLEKRVMIVHEPPYGTALDFIGFHAGSKAVNSLIKMLKPDLCLCGHMHETFGMEVIIGSTRVINTGPEGVIIDL